MFYLSDNYEEAVKKELGSDYQKSEFEIKKNENNLDAYIDQLKKSSAFIAPRSLSAIAHNVEPNCFCCVSFISYPPVPISSLDDNNAIAVASHLATLMSGADIKVIVSTHSKSLSQ